MCKVRTNAHKYFAKRFAEDDLKCSDLLYPKSKETRQPSKYGEELELEMYQRRKFIDWRILGATNWQSTFKSVFEFDKDKNEEYE